MIEWFLCPLTSVLIGAGIFVFMQGLALISGVFQNHTELVYFLPVAGLVVFALERLHWFKELGDSETVLEEIHRPHKPISCLLAPWICVMTWWSHLFGASVGREGTAIQMGASLSEFSGEIFKEFTSRDHYHRPLLLRMGLAGGFAAAFGAPLAGALFAMEHPGHFHKGLLKEFPILFVTSWCSLRVADFFGLQHMSLMAELNYSFLKSPLSWFFIAALMVLTSAGYQFLYFNLKARFAKIPRWLSLALGGAIVSGAALALHSTEWHGLGVHLIEKSLQGPAAPWESFLKMLLTMTSVASGFRGGEVVPLMASGALLGNTLASVFELPLGFVACAGLVVIFSYRMRSPIAGVLFLFERVNPAVAVFASLPLFLSWLFRRYFIKN